MIRSQSSKETRQNENWFSIFSRADCEKVLKKELIELRIRNDLESIGVFLVRKGSRSNSPFVLMCIDSKIRNYPIFQYENNSFFSLDGKKLFRGLDELVKFYCSTIDQQSVQTLPVNLTKFKSILSGIPPPLEFCSFGTETAVHKCINEGDLKSVVTALRVNPSEVDHKNRLGQTPLHLACMRADDELFEIVKILIKNDSNMFFRDSSGDTAFIIACKNNNVKSVKLMIQRDPEIIQARNFKTDDSALHIAALEGNPSIAKLLLQHHALILQMNKEGKYPIDLAIKHNHMDIVNIIMLRVIKITTKKCEWYHGVLDRAEAEEILKAKSREMKENDGLFLIRFSKNLKKFILSLLCSNEVKNFEITKTGYLYLLNEHQRMTSLEELVEHHMKFCDGLPTKLQFPVKPSNSSVIGNVDNNLYFEETIYDEFKSGDDPGSPDDDASYDVCGVKDYFDEPLNDDEVKTCHSSKNDIKFFSESDITFGMLLGKGCFGIVRQAVLTTDDFPPKVVAVKTTNFDSIESDQFESNDEIEQSKIKIVAQVSCNFLREAAIMANFDHPNIVKLIGIIKSSPLGLVQEFLPLGSLIDYLRDKTNTITAKESSLWAYQIANGMRYLEKKKFVHRDLAARNILLGSKEHVKICDFGLSRTISVESNQFQMDLSSDPVPWRNYAPECFCQFYTHKSDVWSFGVTLWEIYSRGFTPYGHIVNLGELKILIEKGYRLEQPATCPRIIYDEMIKCWELEPRSRPTFQQIFEFYSSNDYQNL